MPPIVIENHPEDRQFAHEFADLREVVSQAMTKHKSRAAPVLFVIEIDIFTAKERHGAKPSFENYGRNQAFPALR